MNKKLQHPPIPTSVDILVTYLMQNHREVFTTDFGKAVSQAKADFQFSIINAYNAGVDNDVSKSTKLVKAFFDDEEKFDDADDYFNKIYKEQRCHFQK